MKTRPKSILQGRDYEVLDILINIHSNTDNPFILDCTYNTGKMWKKCNFQPDIKLDINSSFSANVIGDFRSLPFQSEVFDIVVFDPPHLPSNAASINSSKMWEKTYGITNDNQTRQGDNINDLFEDFILSVKQIIKKDGILIAKIADIVHNHRYQWQHVDFINKCHNAGIVVCDMMIKQDPAAGNLSSGKWQNVKHLRKAHCYFLVCRFNNKCERSKI